MKKVLITKTVKLKGSQAKVVILNEPLIGIATSINGNWWRKNRQLVKTFLKTYTLMGNFFRFINCSEDMNTEQDEVKVVDITIQVEKPVNNHGRKSRTSTFHNIE